MKSASIVLLWVGSLFSSPALKAIFHTFVLPKFLIREKTKKMKENKEKKECSICYVRETRSMQTRMPSIILLAAYDY
uniref:Secreted protein n=1 Tax=Cucumis melo TaxID=3656 RepID=A0A9I9EM47_CUCME